LATASRRGAQPPIRRWDGNIQRKDEAQGWLFLV
jgi:hypothetical protein